MASTRGATRRTVCLAAVTVAATLLTACTAGAKQQTGDAGRTLIWADKGQVATLDPARSDYQQTDVADQLFYDALVGYDSSSNLVGRLAEKIAAAIPGSELVGPRTVRRTVADPGEILGLASVYSALARQVMVDRFHTVG